VHHCYVVASLKISEKLFWKILKNCLEQLIRGIKGGLFQKIDLYVVASLKISEKLFRKILKNCLEQ